MCICICLGMSMGRYLQRPREGSGSPELEIGTFISGLTWVLGTDLGLLAEKYMFLTIKPSLQPKFMLVHFLKIHLHWFTKKY